MPYRANYPATAAEVLVEGKRYKPDALRAVKACARAKPWRGTIAERMAKLQQLNDELAAAYGIPRPLLHVHLGGADESPAGNGSYCRASHTITLIGRLSILTYLHEFGHARGMDERQACTWSINLFRRVFPRSYVRLRPVGHMLVRK